MRGGGGLKVGVRKVRNWGLWGKIVREWVGGCGRLEVECVQNVEVGVGM